MGSRQVLKASEVKGYASNRESISAGGVGCILVAADIDGHHILQPEVPFQIWKDKRGHKACRNRQNSRELVVVMSSCTSL